MPRVERVYVAAATHDARFTRICVASIRHFHPDVRIELLAGGALQRGLTQELRRYWDVDVAPTPAGNYGWGFVKLEPLFGSPGATFLVLDSDTVITGPVLDLWTDTGAPFLVDDEMQPEALARSLYYDWDKVGAIDFRACAPRFVFNSGQWFGTAGMLTRADFAPWVEWTMPRTLRHPECFMPGDQGVLNYVLNQKVLLDGLHVERRRLMRWPKHGMDGLGAEAVAGHATPPLVVHWAGLKRTRQRDMAGADLLAYFETQYYKRLPAGIARRRLASARHVLSQSLQGARMRMALASRGIGARLP